MKDSPPPPHLTEYQIWMLRDALAHGAVYLAGPEDGQFPQPGPKGHPIPPHDRGQKRILRNLVGLELMREVAPARFVLTELGHELALHDGLVPVRRSY
jgi:hypothetical protein